MDTQSTATEGHFELGEKYRRWKETYLPAGDTTSAYSLVQQLEVLSDERLKTAHKAAMAGLFAEKLLAHIRPIGIFRYVTGLTTALLFRRGLVDRRSWYEPELSSKQKALG